MLINDASTALPVGRAELAILKKTYLRIVVDLSGTAVGFERISVCSSCYRSIKFGLDVVM